jgi:hypothetical protein
MSGKYGLLRLSCNRMTTESFYRYDDLIWLGLQGGKRSPEHKTAPQGCCTPVYSRRSPDSHRRFSARKWPDPGDRGLLLSRLAGRQVVPVRNDAILPCCNNNCVSVNFLAVVEMRGERSLLDRPRACPNRTSG